MEFIIGGAYQGKLEYCMRKYRYAKEDIFFCGNGADIGGKKALCGFHMLVKEWLLNGLEPFAETGRLLEAGIEVFISDEIGNGIVPMDAFERKWREEAGRCCCLIAIKADKVTRIYCGMPQVIK